MKKIFSSLLILTITAMAAHAVTPSDPVAATIDSHMVITLPTDQPTSDSYVVDVSGLNFKSDEMLQAFCENASDRLIVFRGDFAAKKIYIQVYNGKDSTGQIWDAAKWNGYLSERAPKLEQLFTTLNQQ